MNLSDIIAINICKQGSDNMRIAICDDEVSMVQILEEKIKKLLPDAVIDKYSDCRQRPRHSAEDFSLKEAKSQYFQDF